jgi:hypothetical protein
LSLIQINYAVVASNNAREKWRTRNPTPEHHGRPHARPLSGPGCPVVDPDRGAEQDHSVLCVELRCARWLAGSAVLACHGLPSRRLRLLQSNIIATESMRRGDFRVARERDIAGGTTEYLLWPIKCEHCADVSASSALNVVFKLIKSEFVFGNYMLEQIADGNNADQFCVFDYRQMTHALVGHQGHA